MAAKEAADWLEGEPAALRSRALCDAARELGRRHEHLLDVVLRVQAETYEAAGCRPPNEWWLRPPDHTHRLTALRACSAGHAKYHWRVSPIFLRLPLQPFGLRHCCLL